MRSAPACFGRVADHVLEVLGEVLGEQRLGELAEVEVARPCCCIISAICCIS